MNKIGLMLGITCFFLAGSAFAADNYIARAQTNGDKCYMTAKLAMMKDKKGILFEAFAPDDARLDAHCANMVIKLKNGKKAFIVDMTTDQVSNCTLTEYQSNPGMNKEANVQLSSQFVPE